MYLYTKVGYGTQAWQSQKINTTEIASLSSNRWTLAMTPASYIGMLP